MANPEISIEFDDFQITFVHQNSNLHLSYLGYLSHNLRPVIARPIIFISSYSSHFLDLLTYLVDALFK